MYSIVVGGSWNKVFVQYTVAINQKHFISIEPAFWATFPQALRSACGKVDGSLATVVQSTTVLCYKCCVAIYVGASFGSGSMYFSVGAAAGIGVL